jgi:hypothetical protein
MHKQFQHSKIVQSAHRLYLSQNVQGLRPLQHKQIGFHNGGKKCLLLGTDWVLKLNSLCFVCKRLKAEILVLGQDGDFIWLSTEKALTSVCDVMAVQQRLTSGQLSGTSVLLSAERPYTGFIRRNS